MVKKSLLSLLSCLLLVLPQQALAQDGGNLSDVQYSANAAGPRRAPASGDPDAVFRAFSTHARYSRQKRFIGGASGLVVGGTTIGMGAYLNSRDLTDPKYWYIIGGVTMGVSSLSFFFPSNAEKIAKKFGAAESGHSQAEAEAFERVWQNYAAASRRSRYISSATMVVLSGLLLGVGIGQAVRAEVGEEDRAVWSTVMMAAGAGTLVPGIGGFFIKSDAERSFDTYMAGKTSGPQLSLTGGPGFGLGLAAQF